MFEHKIYVSPSVSLLHVSFYVGICLYCTAFYTVFYNLVNFLFDIYVFTFKLLFV